MKFGKIHPDNISDFALPPDGAVTEKVLSAEAKKPLEVYLAAPAWGIASWKGSLYPSDAKQKDFLYHYARAFNSIELNSAFYRVPEFSTIKQWVSQVPEHFLFCPKISQGISHYGGLSDKKKVVEYCEHIQAFGKNLGMCFLQLPERASITSRDAIQKFITAWNDSLPLAIEFRHESWFAEEADIFDWLADHEISAVLTDALGRRDVLHMQVTHKTVIIRWVGNDAHESDFERLDEWIQKLQEWHKKGLERVYFFLHEPEERAIPEVARYFFEQFATVFGAQIPNVHVQQEMRLI